MLKAVGLVSVVCACLSPVMPGSGIQTSDSNFYALKGIKAVFVLVEDLPQKAGEMGLTSEDLKAAVAEDLRGAGLSVPDYSTEDPYLAISFHVVGEAFSIDVSLRENAVLRRDRKIACRAATWMKNVTGMHRGDPGVLLGGLRKAIELFLGDFREANTKR